MRTKVDLPIMLAREVSITNGLLNLKYNEVNLSSIYGIYDKASDKMAIQYCVALSSTQSLIAFV